LYGSEIATDPPSKSNRKAPEIEEECRKQATFHIKSKVTKGRTKGRRSPNEASPREKG